MTEQAIYPRGWFAVATSEDLTADEPLRLNYFGRKFVGFRDGDGKAHVIDAICAHMGADLSARGKLEADGLRCPFHGWKYAGNGICIDIPGTKLIPKRARVRSLPVAEIDGLIHVWHDPEEGAPDYELPRLPAFGDDQWTTWTFAVADVHTHPREIIDNIADKAHFGPVHAAVPSTFENEFSGHHAVQKMTFKRDYDQRIGDGGEAHAAFDAFVAILTERGLMVDLEDKPMTSHATYHGPGYLITDLMTLMRQQLLVCHTPIDEETTRVWTGVMLYRGDGEIDEIYGDALDQFEKAALYGVYQDVEIWENKEPAPTPMLSAADGPILEARKWYRQFYEPRA